MSSKKTTTNKSPGKAIMVLSVLLISVVFYFSSCSSANISLLCADEVPVIANTNPRVEVRADGTAMVNGKPFFPFGFYHVSSSSTAEVRINHMREIAAAGFNIIHPSFKTNEKFEEYEKFLNEAERSGIYVLTEFELIPRVNPIEVVNKFKNKPVIWGWSIADDVDSNKDGFTPHQILDLHCKFKMADPAHITYISGSKEKKIANFINTADAIGVQAYPVGENLSLNWVKHMISIARDAAPKNRLIIGNVQSFRWYYAGAKVPTFDEIRNMTYQAILAGAKGIIYYTYYDRQWSLPEHPELWLGIKSLVPEMQAISSFLLDGDLKNIETGVKNLLAGIWLYQNQTLAVVINTSYDRIGEVAITLPENVREARQIFPDRASGMSVKNGQLTGSLNPLDVRVYSLRN
ncbi:hypothetical protein [Microcoleus sp. D3_18a_C4]|uniref:hypothetical protein n=1 Tax=unclassified Microcoleus TaxID=2642155 RepID=UPI002FCFA2C5